MQVRRSAIFVAVLNFPHHFLAHKLICLCLTVRTFSIYPLQHGSLRGKRLEASKESYEYSPVSQSPGDRRNSTVTAGAEGILDSICTGKQHSYHRDEDYPERPRSCRSGGRSRDINEVDQTSTRLPPKLSPSSAAYDANRDYVEPVGDWHPGVFGDGHGYVCDAQLASDPTDVSNLEISKRRTPTEGTFSSERE